MKRIRSLVGLFVLVAVFAPEGLFGAGQEPLEPQPAPVSDLPNHLAHLAWQLRAKHLDESGEITGQIEKAVLDHMQKWLAADSTRAQSIPARRDGTDLCNSVSHKAKPSCFHQSWKGSALLGVGYSLSWTHKQCSCLVWQRRKVRLAAVAHFVPMVDCAKFHPR
jgi:hypothetical protein